MKNFAGEWEEREIVTEGIVKMAESSTTFNACLAQFKIAQQNQRDSVLGRFMSYSNPSNK